MPTPAERQALLFLAAVAALGGGVRVVGARRFGEQAAAGQQLASGPAAGSMGERALAAQIAAVDSAQQIPKTRRSKARGSRVSAAAEEGLADAPAERGEKTVRRPLVVDVNHAAAKELERLPRVGPALAARIVSWREAHGPFKSLEDLRHVRGIGPVTAALLAPSVTF